MKRFLIAVMAATLFAIPSSADAHDEHGVIQGVQQVVQRVRWIPRTEQFTEKVVEYVPQIVDRIRTRVVWEPEIVAEPVAVPTYVCPSAASVGAIQYDVCPQTIRSQTFCVDCVGSNVLSVPRVIRETPRRSVQRFDNFSWSPGQFGGGEYINQRGLGGLQIGLMNRYNAPGAMVGGPGRDIIDDDDGFLPIGNGVRSNRRGLFRRR